MKHLALFLWLSLGAAMAFAQKPGTIYPPGKPGVDYNLKNAKGQKDGLWIQQWQSTRNLLYRGQFKAGTPVGIWERYHENGALMAIQNHIKDTTEMHVQTFYPDGVTVLSVGVYLHHKMDGEWQFFNNQGTLLSKENYVQGKLQGQALYYFPSGKLCRKENYVLGIKEGNYEEYYENGKMRSMGTYLKEANHGPFKQWFVNGIVDCEGQYENGHQTGQWMYYNESGSPKVTVLYKGGVETKRRYENGTFTEYYDSGIPKSEYTYENGKMDGPFTEWYDKGEFVRRPAEDPALAKDGYMKQTLEGQMVKRQGDYINGLLEGEVLIYKENGTIERREVYEAGVLKSK